jgi:hypothetical protein
MCAVRAGLIFNGDEKNCEKLGSWALEKVTHMTNRIKINNGLVFI